MNFWNKVDKRGPDDCWLWLASKDTHGYGHVRQEGRLRLAHRVSWELVKGELLLRSDQLHHRITCEKHCVNPNHLTKLSQAEHIAEHGFQSSKTHCPQGHEYSEENTRFYAGRRFCRTCNRLRSRKEGV